MYFSLTVLAVGVADICAACFGRMQSLYKILRKREKKNAKMRLMRGDVPEPLQLKAKELRDSFEKLQPQALP